MKSNKSTSNIKTSSTRNSNKKQTHAIKLEADKSVVIKNKPIVSSKSSNNMIIRSAKPKLSKLNSQKSINITNSNMAKNMSRVNSLKPFELVDPEFYTPLKNHIFDKEIERITHTTRVLTKCPSTQKLNESKSKFLFNVNILITKE